MTDTELEEKSAEPLELFFDLVFVFAITQVVSLIVHDLTWQGLFHGVLVLALMWWGWGVWTWTTNVVDLEPRIIRAVILVSMIGVFIMAHAVPTAFDGKGMWVALGYAYVRALAAAVMWFGTKDDEDTSAAFWTYMPVSAFGPVVIVFGAAVGGDDQQWFWLAGWLLELASAVAAGRADWKVDAGHFAERHGLIIIIALGESIIVVGSTVADLPPSGSLALLLGVGTLGAAVLWWAYFDRLEGSMEHGLREANAHQTGLIARDVYSVLHFPMIVGIVLYAVALEQAFHHPDDPMEAVVAALFVGGLASYLLAGVVAIWRTFREYLYERLIGVALIAAVGWLWRSGTARELVITSIAILVITISAEYWRFRPRILAAREAEASA